MTRSPRKRKPDAGTSKLRRSETDTLAQAIEHHRAGRLAEAERVYREIQQSSPPSCEVAHLLGLVSHQLGKTRTALEMLRLATELDPASADAQNDLGNVLQKAGRQNEAERAYRRAIEANSSHARAYNNLGIILKEKGRLDEAIVAYQRALGCDSNDSDVYYNLGVALKRSDDLDAAVNAFRRAIELAPDMHDARQLLCAVLRLSNRVAELEVALDEWARRDPTSPVAQHMRAAVTGDHVPARASDGYVRSVFDQFAAHFDEDLANLDYDVPRLVSTVIGRTPGATEQRLIILDAGCGTGLCGIGLRPFSARLDGVDLSPKMIEKAAERGVYDHLKIEELTAFMANHQDTYDVIVAGDTFNYFGDLRPLWASTAAALRSSGLLIFTLELDSDGSEPCGFRLQPHGRYNHALSYVMQTLDDAGFRIDACDTITIRKQADDDVQGILVQTRRPAESS